MDELSWLWPGVKDRFFEDLKKLHEKSGPWDLVLFTGDLTNRGSIEEFQKLNQVLEELWEQFDKLGSSPKLLAVPGNHDLVRPDENDASVILLKDWERYPNVQKRFWENAESSFRQVVTEAFKNYTDWLKNQPFKVDNLNDGILPGDFSATIEKGDAKLGIVGLNSTFLQLTGDDYEKKLALHTRQFQAACGGDGPDWAKQHHACLLLTHQPPSWLDVHSQQHLNGEIADRGRFAAHLCGHMHDTVFREISEGATEAKHIWQGRSLFGLEYFGKEENIQRSHGYTAGQIELNGEKGRLIFWPRKAYLQGGQRNIIPDQSIKLTDNQHTEPRKFNLLKPYGSQDSNDKVPQDRQRSSKPVTPIPHEQTVFLALVSADLEEYRDEVKRFFEQQGLQILPNQTYPYTNVQESLDQDLTQCNLFVQLLSEKADRGYPLFQFERACERAKTANLPILQWHDNALDLNKVSDQDHKDLLSQSTVIASTLVEFKEYIINQLKPKDSKTTRNNDQSDFLVYINAAQEDMSLASEIQEIFKKQGIGSTLPLKDSDHIPVADIQKYVEQNLQWCDAVIVLYDKASIVWVNEQLRYCRHMQGRREQPFKVFALCDKPSPEKPRFPMSLPNLHILECSTPQIETGLSEFIRILKT
jgi:predicted MPP superfamily phosphohydrolase